MRIGICEWTTFPASFEDELAAYRAAGAGAIGILEPKLDGVEDVRGKLRESGLAVSACLPAAGSILPSPLIPGPEEPEARVESICASVARFAELEQDSRAAVRALEAAGYDGWYDVEVMSDDGTFGDAFPDSLWKLPVDEIARRAVAAMEAL
jgi:sugar phosphate isomerase/epimerase